MATGDPAAPIIDRIHPELEEAHPDWDIHQGAKEVLEALNGQHGTPSKKIAEMGLQVICLLMSKNRRYGDAALSPLRIFARGLKPIDLIHVRMDDKLSRLARGQTDLLDNDNESPVFDFVGYGILEMIAAWEQSASEEPE